MVIRAFHCLTSTETLIFDLFLFVSCSFTSYLDKTLTEQDNVFVRVKQINWRDKKLIS